jgi:poly-gamma-glutamate synthesis protein (capsule biosynthesis protein)
MLPILESNDIFITNFESPSTLSNEPIQKTGPILKCDPKTIMACKFAGINIVTLANNHILDYGANGLADTIQNLKNSSIHFVGAGLTKDQTETPFQCKINGINFTFINITENEFSTLSLDGASANSLDIIKVFNTIRKAREQSQFVFVIIHGGHEKFPLPSPRMKETYRFFADSGANAIIGHHTHCYSGFEVLNGCPIFYSLGNFMFDNPKERNTSWNEGFAVQFVIENGLLEYNLIPYCQNGSEPGIHLLKDDKIKIFNESLTRLNEIIKDDLLLKSEFENYCSDVRGMYDSFLEPYTYRIMHALRKRKLFPRVLGRKKRLLLLNLIRCESHRDILINLLQK